MSVEGLLLTATEPYSVRHDFDLDLAAVREVAARHAGPVEAHQSRLPIVHASGHRRTVRAAASTTIAALAENDSWVTLFGVSGDEAIRPMASAISRQLESLGRHDATLVLSLLCSSAHGVTPAHMDVSDVLLLQLVGPKTFATGAIPNERERAAELRRRFGPSHENLSRLPDMSREWALGPGLGVFLPAYTPHWARVGDEVSVALSVAISTPELRHLEAIHQADAALVRRGLRLPAPGRSTRLDEVRLRAVDAGRRIAAMSRRQS